MTIYKAYIPITTYFVSEWNSYDLILKKYSERKLEFPFIRQGVELGNFSYQFKTKISKKIFKLLKLKSDFKDYIIEITIEINEEKKLQLLKKDSREGIGFLILNRIYNSIIVFNIASPAIFWTHKGVLLKNGEIIWEIENLFHSLEGAIVRSEEINWPKIGILDVEQVWNWYFRNEQAIDELSSNSVERALNAFSYLFDSSSGFRIDEIFWLLLALESIYCQGNANLQGQLSEKTEIYLGKRIEFKKEVSKMYDFRSRFIHGDLNFFNKFLYSDITDEFNKFYGIDYSNSTNLAAAILIATFQKLVKTNKFSLEFELKLKE